MGAGTFWRCAVCGTDYSVDESICFREDVGGRWHCHRCINRRLRETQATEVELFRRKHPKEFDSEMVKLVNEEHCQLLEKYEAVVADNARLRALLSEVVADVMNLGSFCVRNRSSVATARELLAALTDGKET